MNLFESVNRLLQDKHTLMEAKTVLRVTFDNGMKKDIEFKGSFEAGKKAYLGKNVKAISKDKTPVMLKAVKVEPINESKRNLSESVKNFEVGIYPREYADDAEYAVYDKKSKTWSDFQGDVSEKSKQTAKKIADKYNKGIKESKDLEPMKTFKVTYHDGSSYKTSARAKSEEDFKKYLTQDGPWVVTDEDDETGKETKKKIVKVEMLKESKDESKRISISYEVWDEDSIEAGETDDKGWKDEEGEEFDSVEDAIKFLKKKSANNPSNGAYHSGTYYKDDGTENVKTGETKYLTYHLNGNWTEDEKKAIYKAITKKGV